MRAWRRSAYDLPAVTRPRRSPARAELGPVEAVRPRVGQHGPVPLVVELALRLDVQPREEREVGRLPERASRRSASSGTTIPGSSAETRGRSAPPSASCPTSFIATQQPEKRDSAIAWRPEREELARRGRVQDRHAVPHERVVVLVGHGRALRLVVLAGEDHHRAVPAGAGEVAVLERVPAPVDAGALPVPEAHDPVVAGVRIAVEHLGARERRGGELLVRAGHVADVVLGEDLPRLAQREVVAPERRAGIAADEGPDPEAGPRGPDGSDRAAGGRAPACRRGRPPPLPGGSGRRGSARGARRRWREPSPSIIWDRPVPASNGVPGRPRGVRTRNGRTDGEVGRRRRAPARTRSPSW